MAPITLTPIRDRRPAVLRQEAPFSKLKLAHMDFIAAVTLTKPHDIVGARADAVDLEERADHIAKLVDGFEKYFTALIWDTNDNLPAGAIHPREMVAQIRALKEDFLGPLSYAAEEIGEEG